MAFFLQMFQSFPQRTGKGAPQDGFQGERGRGALRLSGFQVSCQKQSRCLNNRQIT